MREKAWGVLGIYKGILKRTWPERGDSGALFGRDFDCFAVDSGFQSLRHLFFLHFCSFFSRFNMNPGPPNPRIAPGIWSLDGVVGGVGG